MSAAESREGSPYELELEAPESASAAAVVKARVVFDGRRPWPLGLPTKEQAIDAIASQAEVDASLEGSHLRVLTLFPEWIFDEARTALAGPGNEVAWSAASAWRAVVALERADHLIGVDTAGLLALIDETVNAREKLVGAAAFALDGGSASEELISTLDECIGRFVVLARHHERARPATTREHTRMLSVASPDAHRAGRVLPFVFAAALLVAMVFHAGRTLMAPSSDVWLVNGSLESGNATLVPGGPGASEAALQSKLAELRAQHVRAVERSDGQWVLSKEP